jgi:hypothetical protein
LGQIIAEDGEMMFATMRDAFVQIGARFSFAPFSSVLQPLVDETLVEQGKEKYRQGTILTPIPVNEISRL